MESDDDQDSNGEAPSAARRRSRFSMRIVDLGHVYRSLGASLDAFGASINRFGQFGVEDFWGEWINQRRRADALTNQYAEETIEIEDDD